MVWYRNRTGLRQPSRRVLDPSEKAVREFRQFSQELPVVDLVFSVPYVFRKTPPTAPTIPIAGIGIAGLAAVEENDKTTEVEPARALGDWCEGDAWSYGCQ